MNISPTCDNCNATLDVEHRQKNPFVDKAYCDACDILYEASYEWATFEIRGRESCQNFFSVVEKFDGSMLDIIHYIIEDSISIDVTELRKNRGFHGVSEFLTNTSQTAEIGVKLYGSSGILYGDSKESDVTEFYVDDALRKVEDDDSLLGPLDPYIRLELYEYCNICEDVHPQRESNSEFETVDGGHYTSIFEDTRLFCKCGEELGPCNGPIEKIWECNNCNRTYKRTEISEE